MHAAVADPRVAIDPDAFSDPLRRRAATLLVEHPDVPAAGVPDGDGDLARLMTLLLDGRCGSLRDRRVPSRRRSSAHSCPDADRRGAKVYRLVRVERRVAALAAVRLARTAAASGGCCASWAPATSTLRLYPRHASATLNLRPGCQRGTRLCQARIHPALGGRAPVGLRP